MKTTPSALEAAHLIDRLERLVRASEAAGDLNPAQWEALRYFARTNRFSRTPAALADYLASTRGTISRTLASLEAKGYLRRGPSFRDGRSVEFALTAKATKALSRDPLTALALDIEAACDRDAQALAESLRSTLLMAIARNGGRAFGACFSCRYFRTDVHPGRSAPHHCGLLDEPLSRADSRAICVEQEPQAA
jgi:DNA-binding MarR family transcriptional regulator